MSFTRDLIERRLDRALTRFDRVKSGQHRIPYFDPTEPGPDSEPDLETVKTKENDE